MQVPHIKTLPQPSPTIPHVAPSIAQLIGVQPASAPPPSPDPPPPSLEPASAKDDPARVAEMFRRCTARLPGALEKATLLASLTRLRASYTQDPEAAKKLLATGESKPDPALAPADFAAHTALASLLLNLDETLSKE